MAKKLFVVCDVCEKALPEPAEGGLTLSSPWLPNGEANFCSFTCLALWQAPGEPPAPAPPAPEPFRIAGPGLYLDRSFKKVRIHARVENKAYPKHVWQSCNADAADTWTDEGLFASDGKTTSPWDLIKRIGD